MFVHQDKYFEILNWLDAGKAWRPVRADDGAGPGPSEPLEAIAASLDSHRPEIISTAAAETALTPDELAPEFDRMTGTLRLFAALVRTDSWARPVIDRRHDAASPLIGPNHDLRSMLVPLGPVAVFGASNFPLAYGVCGGDTASALAAGCPVVVKEHPAHIRTGRMIFQRAQEGLRRAKVSPDLLAYAAHTDAADLAVPNAMIEAEQIRAIGFTGSKGGGLAIQKRAMARPTPIPVFAEMGSANPVLITPRAAESRGGQIGRELAESILSRFGQQCTCPGIIIVPEARSTGAPVVEELRRRLESASARDMLAPWIRDGYLKRLNEAAALDGVGLIAGDAQPRGVRAARAAVLMTTADRFARHADLREEIFGPAAIIVDCPPLAEAIGSLPLPPSLTLSIYFDAGEPGDLELARRLAAAYLPAAGRIIFNGVPTGVRVAEAMVHGGPYPATNRPDTTAVGPRAIERWCRPVCWQNAPGAVLHGQLRG